MFANLVIGTLLMIVNLGIQVLAIAALIRYFNRRINLNTMAPSIANDTMTLSMVMAILMIGHVFMFSTWAVLFVRLGEFDDFATAFYHSTVNFTSLGYGDIVMSEGRRLLGALEAANGVLMFGLTAGTILSVMNGLFNRRGAFSSIKEELGSTD